MKKLLLIFAIGLLSTSAWAQDSNISTTQKKQFQPQPRKVIVQPKNGEGAIQRGVRSGNLFQMISIFAPAEYGFSDEFVYYDENDVSQHTPPGKPVAKGIRLFGFTF
jgi:hypothetical protein